MDFASDALIDGRTFRILNVMDDYNRECLLSQGSISFPAKESSTTEQLKEEALITFVQITDLNSRPMITRLV
ncbi:MAG: hypothetical protein IPN97_11090 [Saprospiraceae bacterium]|nr:hypothetical protein [Saprospiraceae bacterium]